MQVALQDMYDRLWSEMRQMHERCLIAEEANAQLEKENIELKEKLAGFGNEDAASVQEDDAYLERLKTEVKD